MGQLYKQKHYSMLFSNRASRRLHIKIDVYNENEQQIDSLIGIATGGSVELNTDSTYRRNGSVSTILDKKLLPSREGHVWFDKRIRLSVGLEDYDESIVWYDLGRFGIEKAQYSRAMASGETNITLLDYMAFLDGTLGGNLVYETNLTAESGVKVSEAIRSTVKNIPTKSIEAIKIEGLEVRLPYDLEFTNRQTTYDVLEELVDLYKSQEFFFDTEGVLKVRKIRSRKSDPVVWDFTENRMDLSIDYTSEIDLSNVHNSVQIWGHVNDDTGEQIEWRYRNRFSKKTKSELNIISEKNKGDICYIHELDESYVWDSSKWSLLEFNVIPKFNIETIGEKPFAVDDDTVQTTEQAMLRAEYELLETSSFAETISFSCLPIYLLKTNDKIRVRDKETGIDGDYLVKSISVPLSYDGTMNISAEKIYYSNI